MIQVDCTTFCWSGGKEEGNMVACDNPVCETEWFHFEFAGLKHKPRGKWFCSEACECKCNMESQYNMVHNIYDNILGERFVNAAHAMKIWST